VEKLKLIFKKLVSKKSNWFIFTSIFGQGFSFIVSLFIWKKFTIDDFNLLIYTEIITLSVSAFFGISSDQYILRNYHNYKNGELKKIIFNTWLINWASVIVVNIIACGVLFQFNFLEKEIIFYAILAASLTYFNQLPFTIIRYENKYKDYLIHNLLSVFIKIIFVYFFVDFFENDGIYSYYKSMCIFSFLIIPWYFFYLFKRSVIKFDINVISKIIRFSIPIIPSILLSNFTPIISRVFLRDFGSKNTIAAFAVISKLTSPLTAIQTALKVLYVPQIVEKDNLDKNPDHLLLIAFKYFSVLLLATLIIALFADDVVFLFFSNSIGSIKNLHLFFIATFLSNIYTYFSIGIFLANKNSYFWIPILCQIIIMIFPGVYLIENFELNGLLISELLKYFFYVFSGYILSLYFYRFPSKSFLFVVPLILVIFFLVLFDFLEGNINIVMLSFLKVTLIIFIIKNIPFLYSRVQNFLLSI